MFYATRLMDAGPTLGKEGTVQFGPISAIRITSMARDQNLLRVELYACDSWH